MKNSKSIQGITLIALVITIIILIILAGITINLLIGEEGIINKAKYASFATEMQKIKENVVLKNNKNAINIANGTYTTLFDNLLDSNINLPYTFKQEILYVRDGSKIDKIPSDYSTTEFDTILNNNQLNNENAIYIIDKETADGKENTYIYDMKTNVVFKIQPTIIGKNVYHSYETVMFLKQTNNDEIILPPPEQPEPVDGEYYYYPNMQGFSIQDTKVIYYSPDFSTQLEVTVKDYINGGQQAKIEKNGSLYTFHSYNKDTSKNRVWANVKTTGNELECWWVWIPRYAYKINGPVIDIIFINLENVPMNPKYIEQIPNEHTVENTKGLE
ncbi:MAG: hypothetical protein GX682_03505 [Clostridiaceae bacterium]|nr:hypothetical protein [Clostridiaceae bacterium]